MQRKKLKSISLIPVYLLFLTRAYACEFDIYDYVEPENRLKVYSYKSITEASLAEIDFGEIFGSYTYTPVKSEIGENGIILTVEVTSEGLPDNFPNGYSIQYIQKSEEGFFSAEYDATGNKTEYLILPECVAIGDEWEISTFWDKEKLVSQGDFELPIGHFEDCITIERVATERTDASKKAGERQFAKDVRCSGIGLVSSATTNTINAVNFQTVTTMILKSHRQLE